MKPSRSTRASAPVHRDGSPRLGWDSRSLLIWAITGWALASLLGILLLFHVTRTPQPGPSGSVATPSAHATPVLTPEPAPETVEAERSTVETTTTTLVAAPRQPSTADVDGVEPESSESNDAAVIAAFLRHAAMFTEAGKFDDAIGAYDQALERDPSNADFKLLRNQVLEMQSVARRGGTPTPLAVREAPTEYTAAGSVEAAGVREANLGVSMRRATQAPEFPGELIIEIRPRRIEPGDPYVVRVRLYNKGNRAIDVDSLEVVRTLGPQVEGRGQQNPPSVRRTNPRDTALLWESTGTWGEGQDSGSVVVNVNLADGGQLTKSISW